jgi:sulfoxide reductase catalytic subunit YedY
MLRERRHFLKQMGFVGAACLTGPLAGCSPAQRTEAFSQSTGVLYPAPRRAEFNPGWRLTNETTASRHNNFYEFSASKSEVRHLVGTFATTPWPLKIGGLVEKPLTLDVQELIALFPLEERVYRFRCVEAWAMIVPWTGFPLSRLLERISPKAEARFARFETFHRPDEAPGMRHTSSHPWPYCEGLRLDEAMHPLTLVATGVYGKPLPKQHGAPIRIVVPWKYGFKSIKSVVKIDLVAEQPKTFWETLVPDEYPFEANVNPKVPHPRWSQATERLIDTGDRVRTQLYNGYGNYVANLYERA